jgi:hypothetical protein
MLPRCTNATRPGARWFIYCFSGDNINGVTAPMEAVPEAGIRDTLAKARWIIDFLGPTTFVGNTSGFSGSFGKLPAEEVRDKLNDARERIKDDSPVRDSSQRLDNWLTHWYDTALEASSRKQSTKVLYRNLARKHLSPAPLGTTPLDRLRKTHVDALVVHLRKKSVGQTDSPQSRHSGQAS